MFSGKKAGKRNHPDPGEADYPRQRQRLQGLDAVGRESGSGSESGGSEGDGIWRKTRSQTA
jgi:hypothetical protein